jgi:FAD/FMN-containing dehydrogenase
MVTPDESTRGCDRKHDKELFSLAVGGYGLFGVITAVGLRLVPRRKVRRRVETRTIAEVAALIERRTKAGAPFGYFQYSIDETSPDFLRTGMLTTYENVAAETALGAESTDIDVHLLTALLELAHKDRGLGVRRAPSWSWLRDGNVEWSDLHQLATYPPDITRHRSGSELNRLAPT